MELDHVASISLSSIKLFNWYLRKMLSQLEYHLFVMSLASYFIPIYLSSQYSI